MVIHNSPAALAQHLNLVPRQTPIRIARIRRTTRVLPATPTRYDVQRGVIRMTSPRYDVQRGVIRMTSPRYVVRRGVVRGT
ncbi:hypothetical protein OG394_30965 [Kribbella sp. NBC_01245]|uniref:hypothetical protein n=1 Tax=Kribbella sp. NBC_01245 TaxID=2903578 RepID=UPI002E27EBE3|nr:hypothetical protein [Kribbella sp. NBC_01245]